MNHPLPANTIVVFEEGGVIHWVAGDVNVEVVVISHDDQSKDEWLISRRTVYPYIPEEDGALTAFNEFLIDENGG
jgi:hypothetical protein